MKKGLKLLVLFSTILVLFSGNVYALGNKTIMQVESQEESVKIYVKGIDSDVSDISYQIADKPCPQVECHSIDEENSSVQTLFLLDNSLSVSEANKQRAKDIMLSLLTNRTDNEQFRIATFGEDIEYLTDYSSDYAALSASIEAIQSQDRETYLSDVLYDLLNEFQAEKQTGYRRVIVVSDGVDNKSIGITKEELDKLLQDTSYPIYTLGAQNTKNNTELENMFAISRKTGASYYLLNEQTDNQLIIDELNDDHNIKVFEAKYPDIALDGSKKNTKLTFTDTETTELQFEITLPFGISVESTAEPIVVEKEETETVEEIKEEVIPQPEPTPAVENNEKAGNPAKTVIVVILIIAIIGLIVYMFINKKKDDKGEKKSKKKDTSDSLIPSYNPEYDDEKTEIRSEVFQSDDSDVTEIYTDDWNTPQGQQNVKYLILQEKYGEQKEYRAAMSGNFVIIGRSIEKCQLCIPGDKSISGAHCEIGKRDDSYYIKDLNSGNGTYLNGNRIYLESQIVNGDQLRLGRTELIIKIDSNV